MPDHHVYVIQGRTAQDYSDCQDALRPGSGAA